LRFCVLLMRIIIINFSATEMYSAFIWQVQCEFHHSADAVTVLAALTGLNALPGNRHYLVYRLTEQTNQYAWIITHRSWHFHKFGKIVKEIKLSNLNCWIIKPSLTFFYFFKSHRHAHTNPQSCRALSITTLTISSRHTGNKLS